MDHYEVLLSIYAESIFPDALCAMVNSSANNKSDSMLLIHDAASSLLLPLV